MMKPLLIKWCPFRVGLAVNQLCRKLFYFRPTGLLRYERLHLLSMQEDLNALDAKIGDDYTGSTLANAAKALIGAMDTLPLADHTQLLRAIGLELSQTMGDHQAFYLLSSLQRLGMQPYLGSLCARRCRES